MKTITATFISKNGVALADVDSISETGCNLICRDKNIGPIFSRKSNMIINFFREHDSRATNSIVRLVAVFRDAGKWVYQVKWKNPPSILSDLNSD